MSGIRSLFGKNRKPKGSHSEEDDGCEYLEPDVWAPDHRHPDKVKSQGDRPPKLPVRPPPRRNSNNQLSLTCGVCQERKELRTLPCQHRICDDCINHFIIVGKREGKAASCVLCHQPFSGETAAAFTLCRPDSTQHRDMTLLAEAQRRDKTTATLDQCESERCVRPMDMQCEKCHIFICYRCSKKTECDISQNPHSQEVIDLDERLIECWDYYEQWKSAQKNKILAINQQKEDIIADIKRTGQKLSRATLSSLSDTTSQVLSEVSAQQKRLQDKEKEAVEIESILQSFDKDVKLLSEIEFMRLMTKLNDHTKLSIKTINVMNEEFLIKGGSSSVCNSVCLSPDGHILVATPTSVKIASIGSSKVRGSFDINIGNFFINGIQSYKDRIYISVTINADLSERHSSILVYDSMYKRVDKWEVHQTDLCGISITDDKAYISDATSKQYQVYLLNGQFKRCITEPFGRVTRSYHTGSLLIGDDKKNEVLCYDCNKACILWRVTVDRPYAVCFDEYENIWAWSDYLRGFVILSADGKVIREVCDTKLESIGDINAALTVKSELWLAYYGGLARYQIGYY